MAMLLATLYMYTLAQHRVSNLWNMHTNLNHLHKLKNSIEHEDCNEDDSSDIEVHRRWEDGVQFWKLGILVDDGRLSNVRYD